MEIPLVRRVVVDIRHPGVSQLIMCDINKLMGYVETFIYAVLTPYKHGVNMVQAIVTISEHANRVLNVVKARYGLRDKSQAIELVTKQYEEDIMEPALRPEYAEKLNRLEKQKGIPFKNITELRKIVEG